MPNHSKFWPMVSEETFKASYIDTQGKLAMSPGGHVFDGSNPAKIVNEYDQVYSSYHFNQIIMNSDHRFQRRLKF